MLAGLAPKGSVNKPAGIRPLVYGMDKGKVGIEGLSVSGSTERWRSTCGDHQKLLAFLMPLRYLDLNRFDTPWIPASASEKGTNQTFREMNTCRDRLLG